MMDQFNDNKAGMNGLDKEKILKIIADNTSANFGNHSQKQRQRIEERIERNREMLNTLTTEQIDEAEKEMDALVEAIEIDRDLCRLKVHFDMDMFFAAVEMRDDSRLRYIPMAVGSESMLSTSNYIARKFGVRSAMPGFIARKLCPALRIVSGHYEKYSKESSVVRKIFRQYDENVQMGSLDEACLDLTSFLSNTSSSGSSQQMRIRYDKDYGCVCRLPLLKDGEVPSEEARFEVEKCAKCAKERRAVIDFVEFGSTIEDVVSEIRFKVEQATGLTCSAGIGANWRLAKICSDINKPNGQYRLPNEKDAIIEFMRDLPIRKVSGVGKVTEAILQSLNVNCCGDLYAKRGILKLLFSELSSTWFLYVALGSSNSNWDADETEQDAGRKSISLERTFAPQSDVSILLDTARGLCKMLIDSIAESNIEGGKTVTLKIKFANFDVITRCRSADFLVKSEDTLFPIAEGLLRKEMKAKQAIRLLGVRLSRLQFINDKSLIQDDDKKVNSTQKSLMAFVKRKGELRKLRNEKFASKSDRVPPTIIELSSDEDDFALDSRIALMNNPNGKEYLEAVPRQESCIEDEMKISEASSEINRQMQAVNRKRPRQDKHTDGKKNAKESIDRYLLHE